MKFAIAGVGSIGRRHLKNLLALGEREIVLFRSRKSTLPDEELAGFPVETTLDGLFEHMPDAIIISNPSALHLAVAIPAAEHGCHLLLEKPISHSLTGIQELKSAVERNHCNVLVGFHYRYHPTLRIAAQKIKNGDIGNVVSAHAHWGEYLPNWHPWEDYRVSYAARSDLGGGVVLSLCHPFDYVNWLFGRPTFEWARAAILGNLDIPVEDVAQTCLRFPNGAFGLIHLDFLQNPPSHFLDIIGTKGQMRWNNADGALSIYSNALSSCNIITPPPGFERNTLFLEEMRHFIAVAKSETPSLCTLDDGIVALEIALQTLSCAPK